MITGAAEWEQQEEQAAEVLVPLVKKMGEVQAELQRDPGCNGWHSGLQMFYARNHYAREGKDASGIVLCPVHGHL